MLSCNLQMKKPIPKTLKLLVEMPFLLQIKVYTESNQHQALASTVENPAITNLKAHFHPMKSITSVQKSLQLKMWRNRVMIATQDPSSFSFYFICFLFIHLHLRGHVIITS